MSDEQPQLVPEFLVIFCAFLDAADSGYRA